MFDFSTFPSLTTERLTLRQVVPADAPDVFVFRSDYEVQKYNAEPMKEVSEAAALIDLICEKYAAHEWITWGIALRGEDRVLGLFSLHAWDRHHNRAEIGYDLAHSHWGQRIATEAAAAIVRFGFEQLGLHRIEAYTISDNHASVRMLEKLKFQLEGMRREYSLEDDGLYHGSAVYGLLRHEYRL